MSASSTGPLGHGAPSIVPFVWNRRAEFCETDAAGIVHFSAFLQYMEQAEHALFRELGTSIFPAGLHDSYSPDQQSSDPPFTWPRVRCECEYYAAVRFEDMIQLRVFVERLGAKSVTYLHEMQVEDRLVARGRITAVCSRHVQGKLVGCPIPEAMRESLSRYLLPSTPTPS
ncbi:MAG: acyl-CoA thioesterase [Planctomycetota bacterium]